MIGGNRWNTPSIAAFIFSGGAYRHRHSHPPIQRGNGKMRCKYCMMRPAGPRWEDHCDLCHRVIVLLLYLQDQPKARWSVEKSEVV